MYLTSVKTCCESIRRNSDSRIRPRSLPRHRDPDSSEPCSVWVSRP